MTTSPQARLIYSASESDANMLWATHFFAPDAFIFIEKRGKRYLVMSDLEMDRARDQAQVDKVLSYSEYVRRLQSKGTLSPAIREVLPEILKDLRISKVEVPATFPLGLGDDLRRRKIQVVPRPDPFWREREFKTAEEVRNIRLSLEAAEKGIEAGIAAIRRTVIKKDGSLLLDGTPLTSEIVKQVINTTIMSLGFVPSHSIVASGDQCVDPHNEGSGRILAHTSIIMDIFPRSQKTGLFGDISRTVVRGKASERLKAAYRCVEEGQEIGFRRIRDGVDAFGIHTEILNYFEANGFSTGMTDGRMQGFFHGTGHGLGLDIHEAPGINNRNHTILKAGHVVTVEPGLYYSGMGGVRLEDVVLVTKTGCKNLVRIPKILEI
jgi:Xaa-Pro aminopeptidase